jgi:peptidoglycan-N-acetylglucosamine deacetylase
MRILIQLCIFSIVLVTSFRFLENPYTSEYLAYLKQDAVTASKMNDPLYEEIKEKASKYEEDPQNAVIDRVWKAIPGYNGLKVNIEASYKKMKDLKKFNEKKLVFKEVKPEITLNDLKPSPIYKGNPKKGMVALQVNVAWGNEYLPQILKVMRKYDVKATFFLDGSWVKKNPSLAKMIVEEGHEIGNHAYTHPDLNKLSTEKVRQELQKTSEVIEAAIDKNPKWFAPPSGSYNQQVVEIAAQLNMKTVLWSVDTVDWMKPNPQEMAYRVLQKIHPGAMILMHPTDPTAHAIERIIIGIKEKGYEIGILSQLLSEKRI